uniref:Homeobox domain-containing protein n=1 Tax=Anopheles culicifacies TaxID=139723 RepID=A0A182MHB5_9DIPT
MSPHQQQQQQQQQSHLTVGPNGSPTGHPANSNGAHPHHLHNSSSNSASESGSLPNSPELQEPSGQVVVALQQPRDNKIIAKPLPSRPTPFLHHSLNHPHLHSLLAHCRNPYIPDSQRKGLEKRFQLQKYISKPDRKKLAERLGLKDSQICNSALVEMKPPKEKQKMGHSGSAEGNMGNLVLYTSEMNLGKSLS